MLNMVSEVFLINKDSNVKAAENWCITTRETSNKTTLVRLFIWGEKKNNKWEMRKFITKISASKWRKKSHFFQEKKYKTINYHHSSFSQRQWIFLLDKATRYFVSNASLDQTIAKNTLKTEQKKLEIWWIADVIYSDIQYLSSSSE